MASTQQRLAALLAVACVALLSCALFPPPTHAPSLSAAAWLGRSMRHLQDNLPQHTPPWDAPAHQAAAHASSHQAQGRTFSIANDRFVLDGAPVQLLSGSIHYFRIPPDQWRDRLAALKAMGLNAVQLYVPWNFHAPNTPGPHGALPFEGWRDLPAFISLAQELQLLVLLRPGPYICAEWEFGGFPAWLLQQNASMRLRSSDPQFLAAVDDWWGQLLPVLAPYTVDRGGPIVMVQIENEYGYYGHDKVYLRHLIGLVRQHMGQGVVLYTVDGASLLPVVRGTLPGGEVLTTVDFGPTTDVEVAFALQRRFNPPGQSPPFCVEYYTGWLTHWGEPMANTSTALMINTLDQILSTGGGIGNVNLYMASGGTNFGPWSGANLFDVPMLSSNHPASTSAAAAAGGQGATVAPAAALAASVNALLKEHLGDQAAAAAAAAAGGGAAAGVQGSASILLPGPEVWKLRQAALLLQHSVKQQQQQQRGLSPPPASPSSSSSSSSDDDDAAVGGPSNLEIYSPHITSYDYHCPLGEAGTVGQLGVGGPSKFAAIQQLLLRRQQPQQQHSAVSAAATSGKATAAAAAAAAPADLPGVALTSYGRVTLSEGLYLTDALDPLSETCRGSTYVSSSLLGGYTISQAATAPTAAAGVVSAPASATEAAARAGSAAATAAAGAPSPVVSHSPYPLPMEQYGQYYGLAVYSTVLGPQYNTGGLLQFSGHDTSWAYLDGQLLGHTYRSVPAAIAVPVAPFGSSSGSGSSSSSDSSSSEGKQMDGREALLAESRRRLTSSSSSSSGGGGNDGGRLLQLLVWQLGRNNFALAFGGQLADPKGLVGSVTLGGRVLRDWSVHHICMENGTHTSSGPIDLSWRPLVPLMQQAQAATAAAAAAESGGAGTSWRSRSKHHHSKQHGSDSSASSSGDADGEGQHRPFISSAAEAQAQAMIAAAAEAATGSGSATAAARGIATIRAGIAAAADINSGSNGPSSYMGRGALLLRGTLNIPTDASTAAAATPATSSSSLTNSPSSSSSSGRVTADASTAAPASTFLHMGGGWGRGEVRVNGNSIGRYWPGQGPQLTLYLPGLFLKPGPNEVLVLELEGKVPVAGAGEEGRQLPSIESVAEPDFSGPPGGVEPL